MHLKRWLSGLVLAPSLILFILYAPPWLFLLFILFLTWLGLREFYALSLPGISQTQRALGGLLGMLFPLSLYSRDPRCFIATLAFIILFLFIQALFRPEEFPVRIERLSMHLLGLLYVPLFFAHFVLMHRLSGGRVWVLFALVAVYFGDTTAFYIGRAWGRKKLAPRISPGKTWAGVWGALITVLLVTQAVRWLWPAAALWSTQLLIAAPGGGIGVLLAFVALSIVGDLFESLVKRQAGAKDSGNILPGHGGVWDRIDATLPALPLAVLSQWAIGNGASHG
jgi:phosphatidate cytidylyltransferase